jgi:hypothetical protein
MEVRLAEAWKVGSEGMGTSREEVGNHLYTSCTSLASIAIYTLRTNVIRTHNGGRLDSLSQLGSAPRDSIRADKQYIQKVTSLQNLPNPNNLAITLRPYSHSIYSSCAL